VNDEGPASVAGGPGAGVTMSQIGRRLTLLSIALGAAAALGACTPVANPRVPPPGSPPMFAMAYLNGCRQGAADANPTGVLALSPRDPKLYAGNPEYKQGWDQGHAACYEDELRAPVMEINGGGGDSNN